MKNKENIKIKLNDFKHIENEEHSGYVDRYLNRYFYNSKRFIIGNYSFTIGVDTDKKRELKKCIKKLNKIIGNIEKLDKLALNAFIEGLKDDKFKSWEISLRDIIYKKDKNFIFQYKVNNYDELIGHTLSIYFNEDEIILNTSFTGDNW